MLTTESNAAIADSSLKAVDKLAVRTAVASLELLKRAAGELGCSIEALTAESLAEWMRG
jgi:hypothetical protein